MLSNTIRPSRLLSVRHSRAMHLLPALVVLVSSWSPLKGEHCLGPPPITSNEEFFTLSVVPDLPADWTLDIDGEVESPLSLSLDELREYPQVDIEATLECDYSSGPWLLVGNAVWTGVSLKSLIELAVPKSTATTVTFRAIDGYRRGPFALEEVLQKTDALVAYGMNGEPLPPIQGRPARIALPGHTGNQWVRWLDRIEISSAPVGDAFRQWPIHARITEPRYNSVIDDCPRMIKGMVNAGQGREIVAVEVSTDDGATWNDAEILTTFRPNVWKRWRYAWTPEAYGHHTIFARVIDKDGNVQEKDKPYGWQGYKVVTTLLPGADCRQARRADLNNDWYVDFSDFSQLADQWLMTGDEVPADVMPAERDGRVGIEDLMLMASQWLDCLVPAAAEPSPTDGQTDVGLTPVLAWLPQDGVTHYDVYLGADACAVAAATHESPEFLGSVTEAALALEQILEDDVLHYWRIDQAGQKCTAHGKVWSFKTTGGPPDSSEQLGQVLTTAQRSDGAKTAKRNATRAVPKSEHTSLIQKDEISSPDSCVWAAQ